MNLLLLLPAALANGQTTHMWISHEAVEQLPEGALRDLLEVPEHMAALENGTMFPDGGYAVDHPYGETAHWEPFQDLFRDWIIESFEGPLDPEAGKYVAFYLGLASHGMADQVFDALYMERSKQQDAEAGWASGESLDTSSDIVWAWTTGPQVPPSSWFPPVLVSLFEEAGVEVEEDTLQAGQERLGMAIDLVGVLGEDEAGVQIHREYFPWGCGNMTNRMVPGGPHSEAEIVAAYWLALWAKLEGEQPPLALISSFPKDGGMSHEVSAERVESRLSLIFNRSLLKSEAKTLGFALRSEDEVPVLEPWLFYRDDSHVLHLVPDSDWAENSDFILQVDAGLVATDGRVLDVDSNIAFSTRPFVDPTASGCGCATTGAQHRRLPWALLFLATLFRRRDD
jgi:MYXO-CTERM domain-containing protein